MISASLILLLAQHNWNVPTHFVDARALKMSLRQLFVGHVLALRSLRLRWSWLSLTMLSSFFLLVYVACTSPLPRKLADYQRKELSVLVTITCAKRTIPVARQWLDTDVARYRMPSAVRT